MTDWIQKEFARLREQKAESNKMALHRVRVKRAGDVLTRENKS